MIIVAVSRLVLRSGQTAFQVVGDRDWMCQGWVSEAFRASRLISTVVGTTSSLVYIECLFSRGGVDLMLSGLEARKDVERLGGATITSRADSAQVIANVECRSLFLCEELRQGAFNQKAASSCLELRRTGIIEADDHSGSINSKKLSFQFPGRVSDVTEALSFIWCWELGE
jgi:hypothetical protein